VSDQGTVFVAHRFSSIVTITEAIARTLEKYQVDPGDLFESVGLSREPYLNPDERVEGDTMGRIWDAAETLTGDPCFGFQVGMGMHATNLHAVGYAWLGSSTLREALKRFIRYQKVVSTGAHFAVSQDDGHFYFHLEGEAAHQLAVDTTVCAVVHICREVKDESFCPLRVDMRRGVPPCEREVGRFFGCDVRYDAPANMICFGAVRVDEPLTRTNPAMVQASEKIASEYLARMDHGDVLNRARVLLMSHLPDGEPSRQRLAAALNMSERTLARRLAEREYTFTTLVEEVRTHLARNYLRQSRFTVTDVAFLLGFSDQSNFARAFKRWTGMSPSEFRQAA